MRPWTSLGLVCVVLLKWLCGKATAYPDLSTYCINPENFQICDILRDSYDVRKKSYQRRSTLGENFLRFGRGDLNYPNYGYRIGKRNDPDDIFEDKGYLRFGRRSWPSFFNVRAAHLRQKRETGVEQSGDASSDAKQKKDKVWFDDASPSSMKRSDAQPGEFQNYYDTMTPGGTGADKRFMRFGRNPDLTNGWLHFGKRSTKD